METAPGGVVYLALRCYRCQTFQVNQKTKSGKWKCRMCGESQSIVKVWGRGGYAKDVRKLVVKLSAAAGGGEDPSTVVASQKRRLHDERFFTGSTDGWRNEGCDYPVPKRPASSLPYGGARASDAMWPLQQSKEPADDNRRSSASRGYPPQLVSANEAPEGFNVRYDTSIKISVGGIDGVSVGSDPCRITPWEDGERMGRNEIAPSGLFLRDTPGRGGLYDGPQHGDEATKGPEAAIGGLLFSRLKPETAQRACSKRKKMNWPSSVRISSLISPDNVASQKRNESGRGREMEMKISPTRGNLSSEEVTTTAALPTENDVIQTWNNTSERVGLNSRSAFPRQPSEEFSTSTHRAGLHYAQNSMRSGRRQPYPNLCGDEGKKGKPTSGPQVVRNEAWGSSGNNGRDDLSRGRAWSGERRVGTDNTALRDHRGAENQASPSVPSRWSKYA